METKPPALPAHISSDGREVWDWAGKLSEHVHRLDDMRRIGAEIRTTGTTCGDCDLWMKSSQCPKERNVNGRNQGPSCNTAKCVKFVETTQATRRRTELQERLSALESKATNPANSENNEVLKS